MACLKSKIWEVSFPAIRTIKFVGIVPYANYPPIVSTWRDATIALLCGFVHHETPKTDQSWRSKIWSANYFDSSSIALNRLSCLDFRNHYWVCMVVILVTLLFSVKETIFVGQTENTNVSIKPPFPCISLSHLNATWLVLN